MHYLATRPTSNFLKYRMIQDERSIFLEVTVIGYCDSNEDEGGSVIFHLM